MSLDRVRCAIRNLQILARARQEEQKERKGNDMSLGYSRMRGLLIRLEEINKEIHKRESFLQQEKEKSKQRAMLFLWMMFAYFILLWLGGVI